MWKLTVSVRVAVYVVVLYFLNYCCCTGLAGSLILREIRQIRFAHPLDVFGALVLGNVVALRPLFETLSRSVGIDYDFETLRIVLKSRATRMCVYVCVSACVLVR